MRATEQKTANKERGKKPEEMPDALMSTNKKIDLEREKSKLLAKDRYFN